MTVTKRPRLLAVTTACVWTAVIPVLAAASPGVRLPAATSGPLSQAREVLVQFIVLNQQYKLQRPAARELFTGEALGWDTPCFGMLASAPDAVVRIDARQAVGRVQWFGANDQVTDMYFYLQRDPGWKISAMRSLAGTGLIERMVVELKARPSLTATEREELANAQLTLAQDKVLRQHFATHRTMFQQLLQKVQGSRKSRTPAATAWLTRELHLDRAAARGDGTVDFLIGGIMDNSVGYLYCPSDRPPPINPSDYIWVEKLAPKWYLYRTT